MPSAETKPQRKRWVKYQKKPALAETIASRSTTLSAHTLCVSATPFLSGVHITHAWVLPRPHYLSNVILY